MQHSLFCALISFAYENYVCFRFASTVEIMRKLRNIYINTQVSHGLWEKPVFLISWQKLYIATLSKDRYCK